MWYLAHDIWHALGDPLFLAAIGLAATLSALVSIGSSAAGGGARRVTAALLLALLVASLAALVRSTVTIASNEYVGLGLYGSLLEAGSSAINAYLAAALIASVLVALALPVVRRALLLLRLGERTRERLACGAIPGLVVYLIGGYWINREYLPRLLEPASILGNLVWALALVPLAWVLGWALLGPAGLVAASWLRVRLAVVSAAVLALAAGANGARLVHAALQPGHTENVILISIDTLRGDRLSAYGYARPTPNLDRLAQDGVLFTNAIAQSSWTLPSHLSLLTALYPSSHGVLESGQRLGERRVTLAELLRDAGYETVAFTDGGYVSASFGFQGFDRFDDSGAMKDPRGAERIFGKAIRWLETRRRRTPFFLFLHTYQTHCPYDPPPEHDVYSDPNYDGTVEVSGHCGSYYEELTGKLRAEDFEYISDKYDAEIRYTDAAVGRLLEELRALDLYDDTIVVLTSDHGENLGDHPRYPVGHWELYDEVLRVPLVIKAPGLGSGRRVDGQVESIDVMPTVLDLLDVGIPLAVDGTSFVELVTNGAGDEGFVFSENRWSDDGGGAHETIRSNDWKLLRRVDVETKLELFDLRNDPTEQRNLIEQRADVMTTFRDRLDGWTAVQEARRERAEREAVEIDEELQQKLRALGYLN